MFLLKGCFLFDGKLTSIISAFVTNGVIHMPCTAIRADGLDDAHAAVRPALQAGIFSVKYRTYCTEKNFNNHIGVPFDDIFYQ